MRVRALLLAGLLCALGTASSPPAAAQTERELRVALTQEPGTLNPVVETLAIENDLTQFMFSGLTRVNERGVLVPDLATRVPTRANGDIAADGRSITYHLVHNAKWHDGVPVTSADVAFTFAAIMNPKNDIQNSEPYVEMARVETPGPYTVRIVLKHPYAPALTGFVNRPVGAIVPKHLLAAFPDVNHVDFNAAPIGSGPYKFVAWHRGSDIELAADPEYFRGAPKIARVDIRFLTNDNTMMIALRAHELDLADRLNVSTFTNLGAVPDMVPATTTQSFWEHLNFNTQRAPLDDRRVRQALCYAFDARELLDKPAHGLGMLGPTNQNPLTYWYNKKLHDYPYDPVRAGALLGAAGWKLGPDGMRSRNGVPLAFTLSFPAGNINREQTGVILQQRWKAIGADVTIKTYPPATYFALAGNGGPLYSGKTDVALLALVNAAPDPSAVSINDDDQLPPNGNNVSFFKNAEITQLEERAAQIFDPAQRKKLYDRIQEIELTELPYYTLRWSELTDMRSASLEGVKPPVIGSTFWNVAAWSFR